MGELKFFIYSSTLSIPFYDFPSSPILIIGALGIVEAIAVFLSLTKNISILL
jgi:hypothetical protein